MQEELRRYSDKLLADGKAPLEIRVGVNTGEVVVRSISTGGGHVEYTPIGHTTNLASRMQTVAPTGSIAITEHTRRLVEGYFALKARGPTRIKGVSAPVTVYEVTGLGPLRTRLQLAVGRGLTKFVGREREMEALGHAAAQAKAGHGQIVATMAEAGVGKSRLFFEFKAKNQSDWMVLEAFSVSHGKASAYILKYIVHDWNDERAALILRNCCAAMGDKSKLLLVESINSPSASDLSIMSDLEMLVMLGAKERSQEEFATLLKEAGFELRRIIPTACPLSIIEAVPS
jgi:hypothetical protein